MMNTIELVYGQHYDEVWLDGAKLDPADSLRLRNHSPGGFSWGYGGSGPTQCALGILLAWAATQTTDPLPLSEEEAYDHSVYGRALRLYGVFRAEHVSQWPQDSHEEYIDIGEWIAAEERKRLRTVSG